MAKKISTYFHTLKHLKLRQVSYRLFYLLRKRICRKSIRGYFARSPHCSESLQFIPAILRYHSFTEDSFTFLNIPHRFTTTIDWNHSGHGKLWCYNLTYFDFLNQEGMLKEDGVRLIHDFISSIDSIRDGLEPYPISLRIINWIKFIAGHDIHDDGISRSLYAQARMLADNLEYHLLGNHLLENGFALLFAGKYFSDDVLLSKARTILRDELKEQILADGAHFELSPMYHQIILDRLLDCVNLLQNSGGDPLLPFLIEKAAVMTGWLQQITFRDGSIPLLNDAAEGIAPTSGQLSVYAGQLGIPARMVPLRESGYRKIAGKSFELVMDVGNIGPDYIPGHAHSDTLNFVLCLDGKPLIVDTGTSTYETNEQRLRERRTAAHNTVVVDVLEQSEVWGSFRVARRAYITDLLEEESCLSASHTGYDRIGVRHRREFAWDEARISITDTVQSGSPHDCRAYLHFHPEVELIKVGDGFQANGSLISFSGAATVTLFDYSYAPGFNTLDPAKLLEVVFTDRLITSISFR